MLQVFDWFLLEKREKTSTPQHLPHWPLDVDPRNNDKFNPLYVEEANLSEPWYHNVSRFQYLLLYVYSMENYSVERALIRRKY